MTVTLQTRITTIEIAKDFLNEFAPINVVDDKVTLPMQCLKCGGSGYGSWTQDGGVCYKCHGARTRGKVQKVCVKAYAQKVKRRLSKQAKAVRDAAARRERSLEAQRAWCEANTTYGRVTFEEKMHLQRAERDLEKATADDCPSGRLEVEAEVLSVKWKENDYGGRLVMTVKASGGYMLWGSVPTAITEIKAAPGELGHEWGKTRQLDRGDKIKFTSTIEQSDSDSKFGFFKRPSKAAIINATENN